MLTPVRVGDYWLTDLCDVDDRQHIVGCTAIDADRDNFGDTGGHSERLSKRLSGTDPCPVDGVAEPRRYVN